MLLAVVLQLLTTMSLTSRSHDPLSRQKEQAHQHGLLAQDGAEIDHVHHDGSAVETTAQHIHGHDPADHRHDTPAPLISVALVVPSGWSDDWTNHISSALLSHDVGRLERPPKHLS